MHLHKRRMTICALYLYICVVCMCGVHAWVYVHAFVRACALAYMHASTIFFYDPRQECAAAERNGGTLKVAIYKV